MNKKGFSLAELLVVIAIMAIIVVIAFPVTNVVLSNVRQRAYDSKVSVLLAAANEYGKDKEVLFENAYKKSIDVQTLIEFDYVEPDVICKTGEECACNEGETSCVVDNRNNTSMNSASITITYLNKSFKSEMGSTDIVDDKALLKDKVCQNMSILNQREKLDCTCDNYENVCQYKGIDVNNYLYYNGKYWRVVGVYKENNKNVIKIIEDNNINKSIEYSSYNDTLRAEFNNLFGEKYYFSNSTLSLLSKEEYINSLEDKNSNKSTYLYNGSNMYLRDNYELYNDGIMQVSSSKSYVRLLLSVNDDIQVIGNGSYTSPYYFVNSSPFLVGEVYELDYSSSLGKDKETSLSYTSIDKLNYKLTNVDNNYDYDSKTVCDSPNVVYNDVTKTISSIRSEEGALENNVTCVIYLRRKYPVTLNIVNGTWTDNNSSTLNTYVTNGKPNISFGYNGFSVGAASSCNTSVFSNTVSGQNYNVKSTGLTQNSNTCTLTLRKRYNVTINLSGATSNGSTKIYRSLANGETISNIPIKENSDYSLTVASNTCSSYLTTNIRSGKLSITGNNNLTSNKECTITFKKKYKVKINLTGATSNGYSYVEKYISPNQTISDIPLKENSNYSLKISSNGCSSYLTANIVSGKLSITATNNLTSNKECTITMATKSYTVYLSVDGGTANRYYVSGIASGRSASFTITASSGYTTSNAYAECGAGTFGMSGSTLNVKNVNSDINCLVYLRREITTGETTYVIPVTGIYQIDLKGARGESGGYGGEVSGRKYFYAGSELTFNVGKIGGGGKGQYSGGGSTFVKYNNEVLATAAGGGGGSTSPSALGGTGDGSGGVGAVVTDYYGNYIESDSGAAGENGSGGGSSYSTEYVYDRSYAHYECPEGYYTFNDLTSCYSTDYANSGPRPIDLSCPPNAPYLLQYLPCADGTDIIYCGNWRCYSTYVPEQDKSRDTTINAGAGGSNSNVSLDGYTSRNGVNSSNGSAYIYLYSK